MNTFNFIKSGECADFATVSFRRKILLRGVIFSKLPNSTVAC